MLRWSILRPDKKKRVRSGSDDGGNFGQSFHTSGTVTILRSHLVPWRHQGGRVMKHPFLGQKRRTERAGGRVQRVRTIWSNRLCETQSCAARGDKIESQINAADRSSRKGYHTSKPCLMCATPVGRVWCHKVHRRH